MTNISRLLSVAVALGVHHAPLHAQAPAAAPIASAAMPVPFAVGERLDYDVKFGPMHVGGGSILEGMPEIAEQIFDLPIRRGCPVGVGGLADHVNSATFATPVGLVLYAHRNRAPEMARVGAGAFGRMAGRLRGIFKEFF